MKNYGEAYRRELERAKVEAKTPKRALKPIFDVNRTFERYQSIVEDLQKVGAPVFFSSAVQTAPATYVVTMTIGSADYEVMFFNDSIKVFWRGPDKTPMIYDALSPSRLNALARIIIDRAVASTLVEEANPERSNGAKKVVMFSQS
ncbi:MAG: hypothetical protein V4568_07865 [Pseudomonadota bacterium]